MRYVITGGAGFIGLNLLTALIRSRECEVVLVDDLSNSSVDRLTNSLAVAGKIEPAGQDAMHWAIRTQAGKSLVRLVVGDIRDSDLAVQATKNAAAAVHLAAQTGVAGSLANPRQDMTINVQGVFNYLEACRTNGVPRMISASSAAVLGDNAGLQSEDMPTRPGTPYGASKSAGEAYLNAYARSFGLKTLSLRFANVYGPLSWSKGSVVAAFCKNVLAGLPMTIYGSGEQVRDFLHVGDISRIIIDMLHDDRDCAVKGEALNVATGVRTTVLDLARRIQKVFSRFGYPSDIVLTDPRPGDVFQSSPDVTKLRSILPNHSFTMLDSGLVPTIEWFINNCNVASS